MHDRLGAKRLRGRGRRSNQILSDTEKYKLARLKISERSLIVRSNRFDAPRLSTLRRLSSPRQHPPNDHPCLFALMAAPTRRKTHFSNVEIEQLLSQVSPERLDQLAGPSLCMHNASTLLSPSFLTTCIDC